MLEMVAESGDSTKCLVKPKQMAETYRPTELVLIQTELSNLIHYLKISIHV